MGGGLESRCVGRVHGADGAVYGADGAVHGADGAVHGGDGAVYGADGAVYGADGAVPCTLHEDLGTFYCCRQNKLAINTPLCHTQYFCTVDTVMVLNNTHRMHCCLSTATIRTCNNITLYVPCLILLHIGIFK